MFRTGQIFSIIELVRNIRRIEAPLCVRSHPLSVPDHLWDRFIVVNAGLFAGLATTALLVDIGSEQPATW